MLNATATLTDWLSFRGLPPDTTLTALIEHERHLAALSGALDAVRDGAPGRRSLTIGKRHFGNVRQLPSGRWQARYTGANEVVHKAPETFANRADAQAWLDQIYDPVTPRSYRDEVIAALARVLHAAVDDYYDRPPGGYDVLPDEDRRPWLAAAEHAVEATADRIIEAGRPTWWRSD